MNPQNSVNMEAMQSSEINEIMTALSKAQGVMKHALKDKKNPFFKSNYADLSSVWDACREALAANGLAVTQLPRPGSCNSGVELVTLLGHASGQWIKSVMPVMSKSQDAQGIGSGLTYSRRYSLSAMLGICADDDDDGNAAVSDKSTAAPVIQGVITQQQLYDLSELLEHLPEGDQIAINICSQLKIKHLGVMPANMFWNIYNYWKDVKERPAGGKSDQPKPPLGNR